MPFGLYKHLHSLGIQVDKTHGHPLQKVCTVKGSFWSGHRAKSLGFIQITGNNIAYINVIEDCYGGYRYTFTSYYLEYLIPISEIPSSLCRATLSIKKRGLLRRKVVDIEWHGGTLADKLNDDSTLNQDLLMAFQLDRPIGITVIPEPIYRCIRIETDLHLPSRSLFDCLCRIAQLSAENVAEVKSEPETILFETKIDINQDSTDTKVVDCRVTDRYVYISSKEAIRIDWYSVEDFIVTPVIELGKVGHSTVMLRYLDESGQRRKLGFRMDTYDAGCLDYTLRRSYPSDISR